MEDFGVSFGKKLRKLRKQRNISLRELAKSLNIDYSYVIRMEKGQNPSIPVLLRIPEYFDIDPGYFFNEKNEEHELFRKWKPVVELFEEKGITPKEILEFHFILNKVVTNKNDVIV